MGSSDPLWIVENLFLDSLIFLKALPASIDSVLDLGAGAGFPGVPLKIVQPHIRLILVEARARRASFLSTAVRELRLTDVEVINARAETLAAQRRSAVDAVVTRCAGSLPDVIPVADALVKPGGIVVCSGPPAPISLPLVEWLETQGHRGQDRYLAVYRKR